MTSDWLSEPPRRPTTDSGTPIADELMYGPSAPRYAAQRQSMLPEPLRDHHPGSGEVTSIMPAVEEVPEDEPFSAQLARARSRTRSTTRPEGEITAEALEWLNSQPRTKARKVHQSAMTGGGEPDIDACCRGRAVKIEMKRPGEEPPERQLRRMREWQRSGALVGWACSLPDVQALMERVADMQWQNPLTGPGAPVAPPGR